MTETNKEELKDIITSNDYEEANPIYQKIKKEFTNKLKGKYECENYDAIVDYVFDYAFKKKIEKSKCIENMNSLFNNNASEMINYLWKITKEIENEKSNQGNNKYRRGRNTFENRKSMQKNKNRERSRSYSKEKDEYENYPMRQRGFYPPKGRFGGPMIPIGGGYPPFYPPNMNLIPPYMR